MIAYAPIKNPNYLEEHSINEYFNEGDSEKGKYYGNMAIRDGSFGKSTDKESFYKLIGYNPLSKKDFKTNALELTPNAPKDWTIFENRATEEERKILDKIYENAIQETIEAIQNNTYYRKTEGGKTKYIRAEGIKVAAYHHHTARAVGDVPDCHKHTHIVIGDKCMGKDGKLYKHTLKELIHEKGSDNTKLQETMHYFDQIFQNHLAKGLQKEFNVQIENDGKDNFKINGITDELRKAFSQRSEEINKIAGDDASSYAKQRIAVTRRNKKQDYNLNELREIWQEKMSGLGLEKIQDLPKGQKEQSREFKEVFKDVRFISEKLLKIYALSESKYSLKSSDEILKEFKNEGLIKEFSSKKYINLTHTESKNIKKNIESSIIGKISQTPRKNPKIKNVGKIESLKAKLDELEREHQQKITTILDSGKNKLHLLNNEIVSYEQQRNHLIEQIKEHEERSIDFEI